MTDPILEDTGERMIPPAPGEVSFVFARHQFAYQYALAFVEGRDVLDVGCGTGYGCRMLAEKARRVVGVDYHEGALAYCRRHYGAPNVEYVQMDATALAFSRAFDVALSFQVIEHVHDPGAFIRRMKAALRPGGVLLLTTPNARTVHPPGEGNPFHFSEMSHDQFHRLLAEHFTDFELLGITYARERRLRRWLQRLPFYRWGRYLKRGNPIKKLASRTLDLTAFRVVDTRVAETATDLLAVCRCP